jgi:RNA polymerase sigma factor (sigma-70 family)
MTRRYSELAPTNYTELYDSYFANPDPRTNRTRADGATRKFLPRLSDEEREDVVQSIFEKCLRAKVIENYNPERAGFGSIFYLVSRSVCSNWLRTNENKPLVCRRGATIMPPSDQTLMKGEVHAESILALQTDATAQLDARRVLADLMDYATACHKDPKCNRDRMLLDVLHLLANGCTQVEAAEVVGVSRNTISKWLTKHLPKKFHGLNDIS